LAEGAGFTAGVRGVLKGCATPGFEVAAGAPEAERGVAVVELSAVMGVEAREGVVVKARARVGVRRERQVRQRLQIIVVCVYSCFVVIQSGVATSMARLLLWKLAMLKVPKRKGSRRRRSEELSEHVMPLTSTAHFVPRYLHHTMLRENKIEPVEWLY
jgi:hypothetical protein